MKASLKNAHQRDQVLTKAILNLATSYELTGKDLHHILGISESTITRLNQGKALLASSSKEGEIAVLLLRIYRGLNSLIGNNHDKAKLWLNSHKQKLSQHISTCC